jgi:hypothetical protein
MLGFYNNTLIYFGSMAVIERSCSLTIFCAPYRRKVYVNTPTRYGLKVQARKDKLAVYNRDMKKILLLQRYSLQLPLK